MNNNVSYCSTKKASEIIGCVPRTLRNMEKQGRIKTIRTDGNQRRYDVKEYLERVDPEYLKKSTIAPERVKVCYCRVSSRSQKEDLERQASYMREKYPGYRIIKDYGSGLNFKREGLITLLELSNRGVLEEVVVAYKDRMCRFGFELLEYVFKHESDAKIVVLNQSISSVEEELTRDILQILTVFSAKIHGLRKYKTCIKKDKDIPQPTST